MDIEIREHVLVTQFYEKEILLDFALSDIGHVMMVGVQLSFS